MAWLKIYNACARNSSRQICQPCCSYGYCVQRWLADSPVNYYEVLGLKTNASHSQIKSAYYELSKLYHPDTATGVPNAKEKFANLSAAYEVLGNPHKRALYDRKHTPAASFRPVDDDDIEYRDFLRRRGTFSPRSSTAFRTAANPRFQYDEFYKQHYGSALRYNWEVKKRPDRPNMYKKQRIKQTQPSDRGDGVAIVSIIFAVTLALAFAVMK